MGKAVWNRANTLCASGKPLSGKSNFNSPDDHDTSSGYSSRGEYETNRVNSGTSLRSAESEIRVMNRGLVLRPPMNQLVYHPPDGSRSTSATSRSRTSTATDSPGRIVVEEARQRPFYSSSPMYSVRKQGFHSSPTEPSGRLGLRRTLEAETSFSPSNSPQGHYDGNSMAMAARRIENATYVTKVLMSMSSRGSTTSGYSSATDVDDVYGYGRSRQNRPVSAGTNSQMSNSRASSGSRIVERNKLVTVYEDDDADVDRVDKWGQRIRDGRNFEDGRRRSVSHQPMTRVDDSDLGGHYWVV